MSAAYRLYQRHTKAKLAEKQRTIQNDPKNRTKPGSSIWIYTPRARKKLEDIAWAIQMHLTDSEGKEVG